MPAARHQYEIYIRATPEQVWEALLDPAFTRQYFHGTAFDRPPVQGEPFRTSLPDGSPAVDGTVEVLDPPHRLGATRQTMFDAGRAAPPRIDWCPPGTRCTPPGCPPSRSAGSSGTWSLPARD